MPVCPTLCMVILLQKEYCRTGLLFLEKKKKKQALFFLHLLSWLLKKEYANEVKVYPNPNPDSKKVWTLCQTYIITAAKTTEPGFWKVKFFPCSFLYPTSVAQQSRVSVAVVWSVFCTFSRQTGITRQSGNCLTKEMSDQDLAWSLDMICGYLDTCIIHDSTFFL